MYECVYIHSTVDMNWQTRWSPRALTVVSARKLEKLALNSGKAGGARKMTQNASPNAVTGGARRNNVQIQSAKRAMKHCNSKHQLCTLLHSAEWRRKLRQKPLVNMYPLLNQARVRIQRTQGNTQTPKTERYEGKGNVQISMCE